MKTAIMICGIISAVMFATDLRAQCQTCVARSCMDGGPRIVCEEFPPPGRGCVSSGSCPVLVGACVRKI